MTCLTVTPRTAREAIDERAELIVSHHPVLFKAVKRIRADHPETGMLWSLARAGVAIASPHTAFDNTAGGINDGLARRLGLMDVGPLRPAPAPASFKVVVFTPRGRSRGGPRGGLRGRGGPDRGLRASARSRSTGHGTFFGTEGANPAVGQAGRRETVRELRVEVVCPADRLAAVLAAIRSAHSYEEPAIDVFPLHADRARGRASGRVGRLPEGRHAARVRRDRSRRRSRPGGSRSRATPGRQVERVAIVCGAGDDFLGDAARAGADVLLTGEARFHRALEAEALGTRPRRRRTSRHRAAGRRGPGLPDHPRLPDAGRLAQPPRGRSPLVDFLIKPTHGISDPRRQRWAGGCHRCGNVNPAKAESVLGDPPFLARKRTPRTSRG